MRITYLLVTLLAVSALAHGAILNVPGQFPTIQAAIDAAVKGDTVLVSDGTYVENIDFLGKAITVTSVNGADMTIIDGSQAGSVVMCNQGEDLDSILDGFTLTNGKGSPLPDYPQNSYGGGVQCDSASPTICNNVIIENLADFGGGIYGRRGSSPVITGNTISKNSVNNNGAGIIMVKDSCPVISNNIVTENTAELFAGGIYIVNNCTLTVTNNEIRGNIAVQSAGGGLVIAFQCSGIFENNLITGNTAYWSGGLFCQDNTDLTISCNTFRENSSSTFGGGIYCIDDSPSITGNEISLNTANFGSAGIHVTKSSIGSSPDVDGNIIMDNTVSNGNGGGIGVLESSGTYSNNFISSNAAITGAGIHCSQYSSLLLVNNTISGNSAKNNAGGIKCNSYSTVECFNTIFWNNVLTSGTVGPQIWVGGTSKLTISHSDVDGSKNLVYVASNSTLDWGAGMINADPLFVNPVTGDLHIPHNSPCRDTGDNACSGLPLEDFEGDPSICYNIADMGADEHFRHLYFTGNATPGGNVDVILTGLPGTNPVGLIAGSDVYDPPVPSMWGDWYVMFPWIGPIALGSMPAPAGVLTINGLIPAMPPGPYTIYMQAIIGDKLTNLCTMHVK